MKILNLWIVPRVIYSLYVMESDPIPKPQVISFEVTDQARSSWYTKTDKAHFTGKHLSTKCHLLACCTFYKP